MLKSLTLAVALLASGAHAACVDFKDAATCNADPTKCKAQEQDCSFTGGDVTDTLACSLASLGGESACTQNPKCKWDATSKQCGLPGDLACDALKTETACKGGTSCTFKPYKCIDVVAEAACKKKYADCITALGAKPADGASPQAFCDYTKKSFACEDPNCDSGMKALTCTMAAAQFAQMGCNACSAVSSASFALPSPLVAAVLGAIALILRA